MCECHVIFRFGSFSNASTYKTEVSEVFSAEGDASATNSSIGHSWDSVCVGMQWTPHAGAATSCVARIKRARPPLVSTTPQYCNSMITFTNLFSHFYKLKICVLISFIALKRALSFLLVDSFLFIVLRFLSFSFSSLLKA